MKLRPDFLIVGMQRSGTIWVSATLNEHPDIASFPNLSLQGIGDNPGVGELFFFNTLASIEQGTLDNFARPLSDYLTKFKKLFADLVPLAETLPKEEFYEVMVKRYSDVCDRERGGKKIVGESTPAYVFFLDFIDSLYPGIKKIAVLRDPKDRITSWHFSLISKRRVPEGPLTEKFAMEYVEKRIKKEYHALLAYTGQVHCTTYEQMTEHPLEAVQGMCAYLGIDAPHAIIEQMIVGGSFEEMTRRYSGEARRRGDEWQWREQLKKVPAKLYDADPMGKGIVGEWKGHIGRELAGMIDAAIAPLQKQVFKKYNLSQNK